MATAFHIEGIDLTCMRGGRAIFRALNFSLPGGEALMLEGPNGSGKTSLLRMIAGFLAPAAGSIELLCEGRKVRDAEERAQWIGWFGHQDAAKSQLTVREIAAFYAGCYGAEADIDAALAIFGLSQLADIPCQFLSAGQKKRLALARLTVTKRRLWLLDEPLAALDAAGKALVASIVREHCAKGGSAIIATHETLGLAGRTLSLARG